MSEQNNDQKNNNNLPIHQIFVEDLSKKEENKLLEEQKRKINLIWEMTELEDEQVI